MDKDSIVQIGGNIESALKGHYHLDVKNVLEEAWRLTRHSRGPINGGLSLVFLLGMLVSLLLTQSLGGVEKVFDDPQAGLILNIVITLVLWPFIAGIEMMGVLHAVGLKTQTKLTFAFLRRGSWVALCALLTSLLISIGLQLFILPGIFLAVALSLTIPLVVEKRMSPLNAIVLCVKATRFQWFKLFSIYLALMSVLMLIALPLILLAQSSMSIIAIVFFLFGLSYLAPMFYNTKGILYREIFGMKLKTAAADVNSTDNIFSA
ncbi:hypothetical protein [Thalassomonas sp. RHCl1]|uniref:hypothetical protein n=1 Tax=Thalassomonas sp. RHCl1 TaxID=2995320 RepID=UPI00248B13DD|nr:hypothetical protein [Thalassomonas sp. RHCl1]